MRLLGKLFLAGIVIFAALQLVRPGIPTRPATAELQAPPAVRRILEKDCYSCHSDERRLSWFDNIVPGYWLVRHDILTAREHLDFSTLGSKPAAVQKAALYEAVNFIQLGAMPLPSFLKLHPEARVSAEELATLKAYLAPWAPVSDAPGSTAGTTGARTDAAPAAVANSASAPVSLAAVGPEFNGFAFLPDFESWKLISTTDRGDNHTFRFILGNDVAIRAAQAGSITPWPDGAAFAKIAWQQEPGPDGLVYPGKFVQVELMQKNARSYKQSEGWGWGRWRGLDLKPYGRDAGFVNECTACHLPVRGDDYVYTLPVTPARLQGNEIVNNRAAALPASLPFQPLGWGPITMFVDPKSHTTAMLFGNDRALRSVHPRGLTAASGAPSYQAGSVLALVSWRQREDPHWFGGRIPDSPQSVEFVQVQSAAGADSYRYCAGSGLVETRADAGTSAARTHFILGLQPARLP